MSVLCGFFEGWQVAVDAMEWLNAARIISRKGTIR